MKHLSCYGSATLSARNELRLICSSNYLHAVDILIMEFDLLALANGRTFPQVALAVVAFPQVALAVVAAESAVDEPLCLQSVDNWRRSMSGGRERWVKWVDGVRVRSSKPEVPMSNGEALARARAARAEGRFRSLKDTTVSHVLALTSVVMQPA